MSQTQTRNTQVISVTEKLPNKIDFSEQHIYNGIANMIFDDLKQKNQTPQAPLVLRESMHKVARWLSREETKDRKWLMMFGKSGNGKSSVLQAIETMIHRLQNEGWRESCKFSYKRITARELTSLYTSDRATFNGIINYNLLLIDDLGTEPRQVFEYGNPLEPMVEVFNYRYDNRNSKNLSMIFTTNIDPNDIEERYGSRIFSRFCETCQSVRFDGDDFRKAVQWVEIEKGCPF